MGWMTVQCEPSQQTLTLPICWRMTIGRGPDVFSEVFMREHSKWPNGFNCGLLKRQPGRRIICENKWIVGLPEMARLFCGQWDILG